MSLIHTLRTLLGATLIAALPVLGLLPDAGLAQTAPDAPASAPAPAVAESPAPTVEESPATAPGFAPPPAPTLEPEMAQEEIANPYGLAALWEASDRVKQGTLVILVIMSIASWYVIILKYFETRSMLKSGRAGSDAFWKAPNIKTGLDTLKEGSAFRYIAEQGVKASDHHEGTMVESIDKHTWIGMSVDRAVGSVQSRLSDGMSLLATVGSTAPFVGLFGTTWGIYNALVEIGLSGQASIDRVAGPVGAALILTAIGLAVAVPAVMGYNWMVRRNKLVLDETRAFAGDLHNVLLSGKR